MISQERKDELRTTIDRIERHSGNFVSVSPNELRTLLKYADERDKIKWQIRELVDELCSGPAQTQALYLGKRLCTLIDAPKEDK